MKTITVSAHAAEVNALLAQARQEDVLVRNAAGEEYMLTAVDDLDEEIVATRRSDKLMALLDERAKQTQTIPLEEVKRQFGLTSRRLGMNTSTDKQSPPNVTFRRAYRPISALAKSVSFDSELMHVSLTDGRIISVPIIWFPLLQEATPKQRENCEIGGGGVSLHWPEIDEDISVAGLLDGADWQST